MSSSQAIYQQYLTYYNGCDADIYAIDQLPYSQRNQPNVIADRATLVAQLALLGSVYQKDYNTATLDQFITDCSGIETAITNAYNDAMGGGTINGQIQADFTNAQSIAAQLVTTIDQDATILGSVAGFQTTINNLQTQINNMSPGSQQTKAQADLNIAITNLATLKTDTKIAQPQMTILQSQLAAIEGSGGLLDQLQALAALSNPTQNDLTEANAILTSIQNTQTALQTFQTSLMAAVNNDVIAEQSAIQTVKTDIQPTPPPPAPGTVVHSGWMPLWTYNQGNFPIPQGLTEVDLFVGGLTLDGNGQPALGALEDMTLPLLSTFVSQCQSNQPPIAVRMSIGGAGGLYGNCWDNLNAANVAGFAQLLVNFCHTYGLTGIDFDYEEYASSGQEALVGQLIQQFKALDPNLQTSLCTNAGFGPNFPWQAIVQTICDAAVDPTTGKCAVDRLNIMSYTNPMDQEQQWITGWAGWMAQRYNFSPAQIGVGIDDFDAHDYDIGQFSAWAGTQGYSTAYWAWNPATPTQSNQSSLEIFNSYAPSILSKIKRIAGQIISFALEPLYLIAEAGYFCFKYLISLVTREKHSPIIRRVLESKERAIREAKRQFRIAERLRAVQYSDMSSLKMMNTPTSRVVPTAPYFPSTPETEAMATPVDSDPTEEIDSDNPS